MRQYLKTVCLVLIPIFCELNGAGPPSFPDTPNQAPIGGLGLLAAAGGALAIKKLMGKKKK